MVNPNNLWYRNKAVSYRSEFVYNSPKNSSGWIIAQFIMNPLVLWRWVFLEGRSLIAFFLPLCFRNFWPFFLSQKFVGVCVNLCYEIASRARQLSSTSRSKSKASESLLVCELESLVSYLRCQNVGALEDRKRWNMRNKFGVWSKSRQPLAKVLAKRLTSTP